MRAHVEADEPFERVGHGSGRSGQGEHRPIVAGVTRLVEEVDFRHGGDRIREAFHRVEAAALGDIGDRFDQAVG